jgi:hypothetical protein
MLFCGFTAKDMDLEKLAGHLAQSGRCQMQSFYMWGSQKVAIQNDLEIGE